MSEQQQFETIVNAIRQKSETPNIGYAGVMRSSWVFYLRRPMTLIDSNDPAAITRFLSRGDHHFVIATDAVTERLTSDQKNSIEIVKSVPFFLEPGKELNLIQFAPQQRLTKNHRDSTNN